MLVQYAYDMKRFIHILSVFCLFALFFQTVQAQTVNRKLYLKSGNLMDRTAPTGSTITSSAFRKTSISLVSGATSDATSQNGSASPLSISYTTSSYTDPRLIIVSIGSWIPTNSTPRIDSVKYGNQKLIFLDSLVNTVNNVKIEMWYLLNPQVSSSISLSSYWQGTLECAMGVASFSNIDSEFPIRSIKKNNSSGTDNSFYINSSLGDYLFDAIATKDNSFNTVGGTQFMTKGTNSIDIRGSTILGSSDSTLVKYENLNAASAYMAVALNGNTTNETFKLKPALCNNAIIKAGKEIEIKTYADVTVTSGTLQNTPPFRAVVTNKNGTELFSIKRPTWVSGSNTFTWRKTLSSDIIVPAGDSLHFTVIPDTNNVSFTLNYGSSSASSYVYLPFADIAVHDSTRVFSATGASGFIKKVAATGTTVYVRDTVRMPLGTYSLNNYQLEIKQGGTASGTIISPTLLASSDCQRVYEYAWTPSSPGDYYIISRIGEGSDSTTYSLDTTIFSVCNPTLTPTLVNPTTGSSNGRIDLLLSNSIGDYTYNWSGQSTGSGTGNSITGLAAGSYNVTINSVNGCQVRTATPLVLSAFTAPALTITGKVTNNCTGGTGSQGAVEVIVTSASAGPYTYAWSNGATTRTISDLADGSYTVTVTDNYGTPATSLFTVATSSAITIGGVPTNATCALNDGKIVTTPSGGSGSGYTFKWSNGFSIQDIDKIPAGNYTVTVTDDKGCSNNSTITVGLTCNRKPLANDDSFSALKGASSITGNLATNDSDPDNNSLTYDPIDNPTASTQGTMSITPSGGITFTPVSTFVGILKLRYKITDNGSGNLTDTAIVNLSIYEAGTDTICVSADTARFAIDADPMYTTYTWIYPQGTSIKSGSGTNAITLNIASATPDTLGDVCVTVGNICGETSQKCYPVFLKKNKPIITAPAVCEGNDVSLTVSQNTTYSWTGPNSFTSNVRNPFLYNVPVSFNGGEYKVTTTDAYGCVGRDSILLQVNSNPTLTAVLTNANCGGADGAIDMSVSNGVTPAYRWSNGAIVEDLTTITFGNYGVTVTNSTGCAADTMFSIKDIQGPSITLTKTNVLCAQGNTGAIAIVSPHDNATNYSFLWTNGSTANALSSIATGDYGVVVTDKATGCHGSANVLITEPDKLTLESTQTNVACAGNTGSITTIGKGGTGAYTYAWSSGPTTASLSSISAGTYTVTLTDANSCQVIQPFTITAPSTLAATAAAVDVSCNAGTNGKVSLSVTGGSTPYRYLWSNGATTQNIQGLTAATYTVTVTDASNCSVIVPQAVTQLPALAISESITAVLCNSGNNGAINITASGGRTPYFYAWSNGITTEDLTSLTAQAYVVTVTDANGCAFSKSITVTQPTALALSSPVATNVSCFGGTNGGFTVSGSGGTSPLTYKWSTQSAFSSTSNISGLSAGSYSVTVKDANNCEVSSNSLPITQPTAIVVNATLALDSCRTGTKGKIDLTVAGGTSAYTYAWSKNGGGYSASTEDISSIASGTYYLSLTDASSCVFKDTFEITAPAALAISNLNPTNLACFGVATGSFSPAITGGITPYTYLWSNSANTKNINNLAAGTGYTLTVTDAYQCTVTSGPTTLTQPAVLSISNAALTQVNCNGGNNGAIDLTIAGGTPLSGNYVYVWSNGQTTQDLTGLKKGDYYVTVTDNNNCSVVGGPYNITDPTGFNITSTVQNVTCAGGTNGSISLAVTGSSGTYAYRLNGNVVVGNTGMQIFNNLDSGNYVIRVADAGVSTCYTELTVNVSQPDSIKATKFVQNISCNGINDGSISLLPSGGSGGTYTYAWSNSAGNTFAITSLAPGKYVFTVTDVNACQLKDSVTLTGPSPLVVSGAKSDVLCFGQSNGSITLTNPSGGISPYAYFWSNGATTQNLSSLAPGFYSVTVTDANNCKDTLDFQVTQPAAPLSADIAATPAGCLGTDGKLVGVGLGGTAPYNYLWSNSLGTNQGVANVPVGQYNLTITDAKGCIANINDSIIVNCVNNFEIPDPDVNITFVNVQVTGSVATNDDVQTGTTYANPVPKSGNPPLGVLVLNPKGTYTFISPNPGTYYYDIEVCAPGQSLNCPKTLLKIDVLPLDPAVKLPPVANHDVAYTSLNTPVTLKTLNNDLAMEPNKILNPSTLDTISGLGSRNGTLTFNRTTGDITFTPRTGFTGIETYFYRICDNQTPALCDTANQTIYVFPATPPNTTQAADDYRNTVSGQTITGSVKLNDLDPEGHPTLVTPQTTTSAGKGTLTLLADGSYTFVPVPGYYGPVSFPYTLCDNQTPQACATATLYILIKPFVPDPDVNITYVNVPVSGSVATNDDVPPGTSYGNPTPKNTNPPGGVLTLNPDGTYRFISPNPGTYYFEVDVCAAGQTTACPKTVLKIDVLPLDPAAKLPPIANHDVAYTPLNTPVTLKTLLNDRAMQPGATLIASTVNSVAGFGPTNGTISINSSGDITFTPTTGFTGIETYYYKVCDSQTPSLCDTATQTIYVLPTTPPNSTQASDDYNSTPSGVAVTGNVKTNDYDPQSHPTTVTALDSTIEGKGRLVLTTTGSYTFTPVPGFYGPVSYPYTICDDQTPKACAKATLYILVNPFTPDPDVNITYVNVLINGSVATNDDVPPGTTYGNPTPKSTNPPLGVLTLNPNGTYTFTSPNPGTYYYEVDVCPPGVTSGCPKTLLKIEVLPLDPAAKLPPIANHDIAYTLLNTPVVLLTFNNDAALEPGKILSPSSLDTIAGLGSRNGTVTFNRTTGDITFTPRTGFIGIETYYYKICDNQSPALCDMAIQTIYVLPNTPPNSTQAADDYRTSFSGVTIIGSVKTNDVDPEGNPTSVTAQTTTLAGKGTLVLLTDGSYTFTPVPGFFGPVAFPYTICDNQTPAACAMATLYILIKPFFPDPDVNITYVNVPVTGSVSTNDDAPPGTTYKNPLPRNTNPPGATIVLQPDGTYTFRSENPGVYYYEIEVCAPGQTTGCTTRTLKITVLQVGELEVNPPIAQIDIAYTLKNSPVVLKTTANDTTGMTGRSLNRASITLVTLPANGVSSVNTTTGDVTYTPNSNFVGVERYTYRICDNGSTPLCDTAIQEIYIFDATIPNSTQAADDYYTTFGGTKVSGSVITNDKDPQGHPTTVTPQTTDVEGIGKLVLLADGSFEFEPDGNFSGPVSFVYEICDNQTPKACAKATLYILVKPRPKPTPDYNLTYVKIKIEETDANVATNDILPSTFMPRYTLKAAIPGNPSNDLPIFNVDKSGKYTFLTNVKGLYEFDVYVCPSAIITPSDLCLESRLTINVLDFESPLNPPTALPDFATTKKNVPVTLESLVNDAPGNSGGLLDPFSVKIISNGRFGSGKVDDGTGNIIYTPLRNYVGYDTLTYQVCELNEPTLCDTTYQIIEIEPVSDPNFVQANDDHVNTFANRPVSGNVITNDSDPEGHNLTVNDSTYTWPNKGTIVLSTNGSFVFTPVKSFYGLLTFKYDLCDNGTPQACTQATLYILVKPVSLPSPDINATYVAKSLFGDVSTNDRFIPGTNYRILRALPSNPSSILPRMTDKGYYTFLSYLPGTFIYNVELCPPFASGFGCELTQLKIDVLQVSDTASNRPVAHTDITMTMFNTPVTILTLINDKSGLENGKLDSANVTIVIQPDSGVVSSISAIGNITYRPNATFFGNDTITYKICELNKPTLCATAIQVITVLEPNAANNTSAADDYYTTKAGIAVSGQILNNDKDPEGHGKGVADNSLNMPITLADQLSWKVSLRSVIKILDTTVVSVGRFEIYNDGNFTFTPVPTFFGPFNLPYQQCDAGTPVACARATIYVLVDPPVTVPSAGVSCISDVNITLNQTCQNFVTADLVLLGLVGTDLKVRINDLNPTNGAVLDGVSPVTVGWIYSVFKSNGDFVCSGRIHATDNSAPEVTKPNDVNLICDAVNKVQDVPASWLNTSYQFFTGSPTNVYDNCGGPLSLKVTDVLSYFNCGADNIYATINRSFRYTDKYGNDSVVTQKINFRRPINSTAVGTPVSQARLGNFGPLGANTKYTTINGQVDQNATVVTTYARNRRDTLVFNSCAAPTSSTEIRAYLRDAYKYVYLIDTSTYRRDTAYLFDDLCNYQVSFTYNTFPKCNSGSHIQALVSIMDGCTNAILVDTLSLIFQDTIAPQFLVNSTQLNGIRGLLENAPLQINASIQSCSGSIRLPSNAGMNGWILSSHFNVKVLDNCNASQVLFSYKLETKNHWNGYYVPRTTWVEDGYVAMPMPDQSIVYNNLPIGEHRLIISAFDQCANTSLDTFYFNLVDNTPPVMACKDKLNVSITSNSSDNWYLNGRYAKSLYPGEGEKSAGRVYVSDINDGSRDNCRLDSLYVRRMFTSSCLDFLKTNLIYDRFGLNPNGVVDVADFEPVNGKPDTYWTPRGMPYIEIFCCDLSAGNKEIMVELWGRDGGALPFASSQSAWNHCWSVINIEDKSAPVITKVDYTMSGNAGKRNWMYCTDKEAIKAVQQEDLSVLRFGFPSIFGLECNGKVTYSFREKLHCDTGLIYRTWVVEKELKPGMVVTVSYTDSIFVLAHHKYTIIIPADVLTDCADHGGQSIPGVTFDEDGCDLMAISMSPDRIYDRDVKGDQCKTIYRTSTVINWCQVPNQFQCSNAADPMLFATVLPRNTSSIAQVYQFEKKMVSPPSVVSQFVNGPMIVNALGSTSNIFNALLKLNPGCTGTLGEQSFAWQYTQIIVVKDTVAPVIGADYIAPDFGVSSQNQCLAAGKIAFKVTDNCTSSPLWLEKAVIYEKNGQVAVGKVNTLLPLSFTKSVEISVSDLTAGVSAAKQYELLLTVRDGCGVYSSKRLPFTVSVKAAPSIICVQTLTTSLMKTDDNQAMQRIRAIDFFQDITRDWSAGACSPVVAVGISRDMNAFFSSDSSVVVTCNDIGVIPVKVFLKDTYGNISFCSTFIEVEDNANLCPASNIQKSDIAGVIRTVNKLPIPKVSMKLSGYKDKDLLTNDKGIYNFEALPNGFDYTVKPTLDKDHLNGVSTFDLILISKHILGLKLLETPHQLIAADINRSGSISTLDLIQLRKLILNVTNSFPNNTSWRFIRESYIFPNLGNSWTNNFHEIFNLNNLKSNSYGNFVGIKIGDVSGNVDPSNAISSVIRSDKNAVPLNVMVKSLANGQFQCTFFIPYQEQPDGFQITLQWANGLSLVNVLPKMLENEHIGSFIPENMLTFSWNGDKKSGELITLTFQTPDGNWSNDYLSLTNRLTPIEAYLGDETVGMKLTFPAVNNTDEAALLQNYPNPFHQVTNLPFYLPEAGEVLIEISTLSGGLVKVIKAEYTKGIHQVAIGKKDLQTAGVYLATMKYKSQVLINKLVMVND